MLLHDLDLLALKDRLKTAQHDGKSVLFDPVRRMWVRHTPEELVRQLAIAWLFDFYGIGRGFITTEKSILTGLRHRRFDAVVLDPGHRPWMLVECKSPTTPINDQVWIQASVYNRSLGAPFVWLTNGPDHRLGAWDPDQGHIRPLDAFPARG